MPGPARPPARPRKGLRRRPAPPRARAQPIAQPIAEPPASRRCGTRLGRQGTAVRPAAASAAAVVAAAIAATTGTFRQEQGWQRRQRRRQQQLQQHRCLPGHSCRAHPAPRPICRPLCPRGLGAAAVLAAARAGPLQQRRQRWQQRQRGRIVGPGSGRALPGAAARRGYHDARRGGPGAGLWYSLGVGRREEARGEQR